MTDGASVCGGFACRWSVPEKQHADHAHHLRARRSPTKAASRPTFDGGRLKCRATRAFTWFSNMLLIYRKLYRARVKGMSIKMQGTIRSGMAEDGSHSPSSATMPGPKPPRTISPTSRSLVPGTPRPRRYPECAAFRTAYTHASALAFYRLSSHRPKSPLFSRHATGRRAGEPTDQPSSNRHALYH